jgi:hypothetical protein
MFHVFLSVLPPTINFQLLVSSTVQLPVYTLILPQVLAYRPAQQVTFVTQPPINVSKSAQLTQSCISLPPQQKIVKPPVQAAPMQIKLNVVVFHSAPPHL